MLSPKRVVLSESQLLAGLPNEINTVTELKRTQEGLRTSEIRYRRLFEAARDGILVLDAATLKITDVNPFMTELLGLLTQRISGERALGNWTVQR